jgi:hypothetical protein
LGNVLEAKPKGGISYTWRSMLKGVQLLRKRVGNGNFINIWRDPWIPRRDTIKVITPRGTSILHKVSELINPIIEAWDEQLVRDTFWAEDANIILISLALFVQGKTSQHGIQIQKELVVNDVVSIFRHGETQFIWSSNLEHLSNSNSLCIMLLKAWFSDCWPKNTSNGSCIVFSFSEKLRRVRSRSW